MRNKLGQFIKGHGKGLKKSKKTKEKMSKNHSKFWKGKKRTEEERKIRSEKLRGNKSPHWKGGITSLRRRIWISYKYRQWRSDIFTRDNYTCQWCGQYGWELNADHHPKKFSDIIKEYKIKTVEEALVCEELWNLNNGRTLCKKCHLKTSTWGNRKI